MAIKVPSDRTKLVIHCIYIILVVAAMGLSVPRLFMKNQPRTRANTIALGMGAKSLIFAAYQLITEYVPACKRWASLKAYWILNALDVVFWAAVCFLVLQANLSRCVGVSCILSWIVVGLAVVLSLMALGMAVIDFFHWKQMKTRQQSAKQSSEKIFGRQRRAHDEV